MYTQLPMRPIESLKWPKHSTVSLLVQILWPLYIMVQVTQSEGIRQMEQTEINGILFPLLLSSVWLVTLLAVDITQAKHELSVDIMLSV